MSNTTPDLVEFRIALSDGVHAALRYLNSRTPHRFTGVYRYDGDVLRNMACLTGPSRKSSAASTSDG